MFRTGFATGPLTRISAGDKSKVKVSSIKELTEVGRKMEGDFRRIWEKMSGEMRQKNDSP